MAKKPYKVVGNLMGVPLGAVLELDEDAVTAQGLLDTLFEETPEGSTVTDLTVASASAPETAVDDASDAGNGDDGSDPKTSSPAGSGTGSPDPAPPVPPKPPIPPKPAAAAPAGVGAQPVVTPEAKK